MSQARVSLFVFGLYMFFAPGLGFILMPRQILHLFGLTAGDDVWIRVVGVLASIIGFYYIQVARTGLDRFIPWTVAGRSFAAAMLVMLVVLNMAGPGLLLFAAIDLTAAAWTWVALRSTK